MVRLVTSGLNILCFLREAFSALRAASHCGHSSNVKGLDSIGIKLNTKVSTDSMSSVRHENNRLDLGEIAKLSSGRDRVYLGMD